MEHFPTAPQESDIPQEAGPLADWIDEELGDPELAQFLREHPEGLKLCANGESILPRTPFQFVEDLGKLDSQNAVEIVKEMGKDGMLPELSVDHIVGNISDRQKDIELLRLSWKTAKDQLSLAPGEEEKNTLEQAIISYANSALDQLRLRFGILSKPVSDEAVRFSPEFPFSGSKTLGEFALLDQMARVDTNNLHPMTIANIAIHEIAHFKSYGSISVDEMEAGIRRSFSRVGLTVHDRRTGARYLNALNEAVTEETANRLLQSMPEDHPELGVLAVYCHQKEARIATTEQENLTAHRLKPHWILRKGVGNVEPSARDTSAYTTERNLMEDLFEKLIDRNPERFAGQTREEAHEALFEMLQKAMFTGNILPFGRLFNDTFGRGKFREYGHLQTNEEIAAFIAGL